MSTRTAQRPTTTSRRVDLARDELFSHILRCGVIDASPEHQAAWFDDTMGYLEDRYEDLTTDELTQLRVMGERYCQPPANVR